MKRLFRRRNWEQSMDVGRGVIEEVKIGTHLHHQEPGRDAERDHVAQTVELGAKVAGGVRQPGHLATRHAC